MSKGLLGLMSASALVAGVVVPVGDVGVKAAEPTAEQYFTFDSSTGTITGYNAVGGGTNVVIPSTIGGVAVTGIGKNAFSFKGLTSVVIPGSVESIGGSAFYGNQLTSIEIPGSVKSVGDMAFQDNKIKSAVLNEGLEMVGTQMFTKNQITSVEIPGSVKSIGVGAFKQNQLTSVVLNEGLENIENGTFYGNQINSVEIPGSVKNIGEMAFHNNQITRVELPKSVSSLGNHAFQTNPLERVEIKGTPTFGTGVFYPSVGTTADVPIYGIAGSTVETYANGNNHPFNPIDEEEEGDDNTGDDNTSGTTSSTADQNVQLKINAGDLYLDAPEIVDFGEVTLGESAKVVGTKFTDSFKVTDARGTGEGWKLTVKATNFKEVEPTGGFKDGTGGYELPYGSLTITSDVVVEQLNGNEGILPSKALSSSVVIDAESPDSVLISEAGIDEGMGAYGYSYGEGALQLVVDPSTAKIDLDNYVGEATPYESTVTWELVSGL